MILIDTDLWIDFFSGVDPGARVVADLLTGQRAVLSAVTAFELHCGATRPHQSEQVDTLVSVVEPVPLTHHAGRIAASHYVRLRRRGELIGNQDLLLAGTALERGLPVLTRHRAHFERIEGLEVLGPEEAAIDEA